MKIRTMQQLARKVEWEGGVIAAIEEGISSEDVPEEIRLEWSAAEEAAKTIARVYDALPEVVE